MRYLSGKRLLLAACLLVAVVVLAACGGGAPAPEQKGGQTEKQAAAPKFPSKDITFIVPVSPGGGYDTYSRILAPFLQKYLPNNPNVVVKNVPGGEWRLGIMEMYKAQPDGHTISIFNIPGNVAGQVTGQAEYDLTKVNWIGRITDTVYVTALSAKSKFRTLEDLRKADVVKAGVVGLSSTAGLSVIISAKEMGYKVNPINHDGSQEAIMSAIRGDVDLVTYPYPTLQKFFTDGKDLLPFVVYADKRLKDLPDTPTIGEMGFPGLLGTVRMDYMLGTTPGVPEEVLKVWRDSFDKAVADPEFQRLMAEAKQPASPLKAEEAAKAVKDAISGYEKYKDLILQYSAKK